MNDILLLGNINTGPKQVYKQKAQAKPSTKRVKQPNSLENAVAKHPRSGVTREDSVKRQFSPKGTSKAFKISSVKHSGFSKIPKPPPPPNSLHRGNNDYENKSANQFIKPSNRERDVRPKQFNSSTFKTSKLFDSDTFKEISEIEK